MTSSDSKKIAWAFAVLGIFSVALTFYSSVIMEAFPVVYCDDDDCYEEMTEEMLGEETDDVAVEESTLTDGAEESPGEVEDEVVEMMTP